MKKILCLGLFLGWASFGLLAQYTVMSFNIRYDNPNDGENWWKYRKDKVAQLIQFYDTDILGLQEVLKGQLDDLEERLPSYEYFGVGRDDGKTKGEYSPVLYNTEKFELLENGTFWLSKTPDVPGSKDWDAAITRICTWAKFRDKQTEQEFYFFNTHFDHRGVEAREQSAALIAQKISEIAGNTPGILTGDFNAAPTTVAYQNLVAGENALTDAIDISQRPHYGPLGTFNGFRQPEEDDGRRIDYVFVKNGVKVHKHGILTDSWGGKLPSDHFPVLAEVSLP